MGKQSLQSWTQKAIQQQHQDESVRVLLAAIVSSVHCSPSVGCLSKLGIVSQKQQVSTDVRTRAVHFCCCRGRHHSLLTNTWATSASASSLDEKVESRQPPLATLPSGPASGARPRWRLKFVSHVRGPCEMDLRDDSAERTPLLQEQSDSSFPSYNVQARDELPPPYSTQYAAQGNIVPCRVCGNVIDITNRRDQHVVKCSHCNEATPIRHAPPGKKYVRCPCNCLLICNVTSQRIGCPRANCHRIINLAPSTTNIPPASVPGLCRVSCVHCHQTFLFNTLNNALSRCPHCRKVSSVGPQFARTRGILSLVLALVILAITLGITLGTYQYALEKKGIYVVYACGLIAFLLFLLRSLYYLTMRVSHIEEPA